MDFFYITKDIRKCSDLFISYKTCITNEVTTSTLLYTSHSFQETAASVASGSGV